MRILSICLATGLLAAGCAGHTLPSEDLKVTRAVLYQNGIGYFERHGKVSGQKIALRIMPHQITDVLKSLTVVDLSSGKAVNVALPVEKTRSRRLATLPAQVRDGGGILSVAQAFRGARATVRAGDGSGTGRLVGVEQLAEQGQWRLTILRDDGTMQAFDLSQVRSLSILDRTLEVGLRKALDVSLDQGSWKPVELTVHLAGARSHDLLVSYVVEMPTWKPAYRVVLSKGDKEGLLQGWAVVDNVSGEDWEKVSLSLTAGTPLTFTYDLYTPRYVRRPDLSPRQEETALAPPPPTSGAVAMDAAPEPEPEEKMSESSPADEVAASTPAARRGAGFYKERSKKSGRRGSGSAGSMAAPAESPAPPPPPPAPRMTSKMLEQSFSALVKGSQVGSLYRYDIEQPVTIRDRQSALVSILNKRVPAEDVLLFRMDTSTTFPYRAVRLTNSTGTLMESGPVAIYRDGNFVGEAVGGKVESGTSTFIPYSVDGRVMISLSDSSATEGARLLKVVNGQFYMEVKQVAVHKYTVVNSTGQAATLYIQRRTNPGWKLVKPDKGVLMEKDHFFVPVALKDKGKTEIEVREETPVRRWAAINSSLSKEAIQLYVNDAAADAKVSASLKEALALQDELAQLERLLSRLEREKSAYSRRQEEVRENLRLLGKSLRNKDLAAKLTKTLLELEQKLNDVTRELVEKDMKRGELQDRLTVLVKSVTLEVKE